MHQILVRRDKIAEYNANTDLSPLRFIKLGKEVKIAKSDLKFNPSGSPNRKYLIKAILTMSQTCSSMNIETGIVETPRGKNRSVIDIWRHAIYMYPDMDIYRIMEAMHTLCKDGEVFGQFCRRIKRAVFRNFNFSHLTTNMHFMCNEYAISFNSWEVLH